MPIDVSSRIHVWSSQTHVCTLPDALESQCYTPFTIIRAAVTRKSPTWRAKNDPLLPIGGRCINPECSVHVRLHQPKLFITRTPHQNGELAVTTLVPRPGRVARFIQRFAKCSQSPRSNQSPTNPNCWHSHYHCLVVWQLRVWRRCGHLQNPTMPPTSSFVQPQNINRPTLLLCNPKKPTCPCSRITIESSWPCIVDGTFTTQTSQNTFRS